MEIRLGTIEDLPQIKQGLVESWVEHARQEPGLLDEERMRNSDIEGYYQPCFDPITQDQHRILIAEEDGQFAGFVRADLKHLHPFFTYPDIVFLDDIYVTPQFRGSGIARSLIEQVEEWTKEKGIKRIQARVYTFNKPMHKVLGSLGYYSPHSIWDKVLE